MSIPATPAELDAAIAALRIAVSLREANDRLSCALRWYEQVRAEFAAPPGA